MYLLTNYSKRVRKSRPETQIRIAVFLGYDLVWEPWLVEACGGLWQPGASESGSGVRSLAQPGSQPGSQLGASQVGTLKKLEYSSLGGCETGGLEDLRL